MAIFKAAETIRIELRSAGSISPQLIELASCQKPQPSRRFAVSQSLPSDIGGLKEQIVAQNFQFYSFW
jgi:hypothetical protein